MNEIASTFIENSWIMCSENIEVIDRKTE